MALAGQRVERRGRPAAGRRRTPTWRWIGCSSQAVAQAGPS